MVCLRLERDFHWLKVSFELQEECFECLTSWHQALGLPTRHSYPGKKHVCPHLMMHILLENSVFLMI